MTHHPTHAPTPTHRPTGLPTGITEPGVIVPRSNTIRPGQETVSAAQARELAERETREDLLARLGVPVGPDDGMDQFADHIAEATGMLYGFVNIFRGEQTFVGLHNPPPETGLLILDRTMSLEHGWCPAVVRRRRALPLWDVHASPQFSGNLVVDMVGIRSYFGAPLIVDGTVLGTVCAIDPDARPRIDAQHLLDTVKDAGALVLDSLTSGASAR